MSSAAHSSVEPHAPYATGGLVSRRSRLWRHLSVLALMCVLTGVMANPLIRDPAHLTIGEEGDNLFGIRQLWWMKHALVDLHQSPYFDADTAYPVGHDVARGELFPAVTIPAIPLTMLWGPVVAYNVVMFLTFALTGFGTYLWVERLSGSSSGAIVAGIIAAFLPYRFAHVIGHLDLTNTQWMPWTLYAFERFLAHKRLRSAIALGVFAGLGMLSAWYYAYSLLVLLPVYALVRTRPWREHWDAAWWRGIAAAGVVTTLIVTPFLIPYARLRLQGELTRELWEFDRWSLNPYSFFQPNRHNPVFSSFMERHFLRDATEWMERGVALGYVAMTLAIVALVRSRRRVLSAVMAVWVVSFVLALGPSLHIGDRQLNVDMPPAVTAASAFILSPLGDRGAWLRDKFRPRRLSIPLPAYFLYRYVPLTSGMRVMSRFGVWTGLMTAAMAGVGTAALLELLRRRPGGARLTGIVVVAISGLVLAESYSRLPVMEIHPRAVDQWLAQQPRGDWSVIELPFDQTHRYYQDYYKTVHGQPTVIASPAVAFQSPEGARRWAVLPTFPSPEAMAMLRECRVRYVLFTPSQIRDWPRLKAAIAIDTGLTFDREIEGVLVYRLGPGPLL